MTVLSEEQKEASETPNWGQQTFVSCSSTRTPWTQAIPPTDTPPLCCGAHSNVWTF